MPQHRKNPMRTLDTKFLAENPADGKQSVIVLSKPVDQQVVVASNPDGTRPVVTLKATGDKHSLVLAGLAALNDDSQLVEIAEAMAGEQFFALHHRAPAHSEEWGEFAEQVFTPHPVHEITMGFDADGASHEVQLEITAPSIQAAILAISEVTGPRALLQTAIALCPRTDDDFEHEDGNEVLVLG